MLFFLVLYRKVSSCGGLEKRETAEKRGKNKVERKVIWIKISYSCYHFALIR